MVFDLASLGWGSWALIAAAVLIALPMLKVIKGGKNVRNAAIILAVVGVFGGGLSLVGIDFAPFAVGGLAVAGVTQPTQETTGFASCPDDGDSSFTPNVLNELNQTTERIDVTTVFTGADGSVVAITDTSSPTATLINCGVNFVGRGTGSATVQSKFYGLSDGAGSGASISNGNWVINPDKSNYYSTVKGRRMASIETQVYDKVARALLDAGPGIVATNTSFAGGAWEWESSTNGTALAVGAGAQIHLEVALRATRDDSDVNDRGVIFAIDAVTDSIFDDPVITYGGQVLANKPLDSSGMGLNGLTSNELAALTRFNWIYIIPEDNKISRDQIRYLDWVQNALSGVDPGAADNLNYTTIPRVGFRSNDNPDVVKYGAFQDDPSNTLTIAGSRDEWFIDIA